jgi:hypothetical protein
MSDKMKADRFWSKVDKTDSCWLWRGAVQSRGYGHLQIYGNSVLAHRHSWALVNGAIPRGAVIDHRCRVRQCVNPAHMELVTPRENTMRGIGPTALNARKTHCPKGHPYTRFNKGKRYCRKCPHRKSEGTYGLA